jgi:hypothetical protein
MGAARSYAEDRGSTSGARASGERAYVILQNAVWADLGDRILQSHR